MPNRITRSLGVALLTALSLSLAPVAGAQTEEEPTSGGPKRVKVPEASADAPAEDTAGAAEAGEEPGGAQEATAAEDAPGAEAAGAAEAETGGEVMVADEPGPGPFVGDFTIGDADAPVQVIEYASFTCPHCAAWHEAAWPEIKADFIEPGRIGFTMREVYFDRYGLWASMAARCGGEQAFYPLAAQYLQNQEEWTQADDIGQAIAAIARRSGLTDQQLKACLENQDFAKMLVEAYQESATADEVQSTPTFLIRGPDGTETVVGNKPAEVREAIEAALAAG